MGCPTVALIVVVMVVVVGVQRVVVGVWGVA